MATGANIGKELTGKPVLGSVLGAPLGFGAGYYLDHLRGGTREAAKPWRWTTKEKTDEQAPVAATAAMPAA